jgi:hypothetical protein
VEKGPSQQVGTAPASVAGRRLVAAAPSFALAEAGEPIADGDRQCAEGLDARR